MRINMDLYHILRGLNIEEDKATKASSLEELKSIEERLIGIEKEMFYHRFAFGFIIGLILVVLGKVW